MSNLATCFAYTLVIKGALFLTSRKSDVEFGSMRIANQKLSLARDLSEISDSYSRDLNKRKLVWSMDNDPTSANTVDVSYDILMKPNNINPIPYLVTDPYKRVVLDDQYADAMDSIGGKLNDRDGFIKFLMKGVPDFDISKYPRDIKTDKDTGAITEPGITPPGGGNGSTLYGVSKEAYNQVFKALMFDCDAISRLKTDGYMYSEEGNQAWFDKMITQLQNLSNTVKIAQAEVEGKIVANINNPTELTKLQPTRNDLNLLQQKLTQMIGDAGGCKRYSKDGAHKSKDTYQKHMDSLSMMFNGTWKYDHATDAGDNLKSGGITDTTVENSVSSLTERLFGKNLNSEPAGGGNGGSGSGSGGAKADPNIAKVKYYDLVYIGIQQKGGWVRDNSITNKDYLQNGVRNNKFQIEQLSSSGYWTAEAFGTNTQMRDVPDTEGRAAAQSKYETQKNKLNEKEKQLDVQLKNLDTERAALDTEIDSVKTIINKNIERSFKMFQA